MPLRKSLELRGVELDLNLKLRSGSITMSQDGHNHIHMIQAYGYILQASVR